MFSNDKFSNDDSFFGNDDADAFCYTEDDDVFFPNNDEQRSNNF